MKRAFESFVVVCLALIGAVVFFQLGWLVRNCECEQQIEAKLKAIHENSRVLMSEE